MNTEQEIPSNGIVLGREHWDVPLRVELRPYLHFCRRLDSQLRRLVVRWSHAASPSARGVPATRGQQIGTSAPTITKHP